MLLMMGVTLYTSRVVLSALGVEDFGVYNVVGGMVSMFTMISGSLSSAISRFITYEMGKGNKERLKLIFSTSIVIQLILSAIIIVLIETVGVWFLNNKMDIPQESMQAARWVLQFSMLALVVNLLSIPYNALIIANEKMSAFAYVSILEAFGKLAIAYLIMISPMHRLVFYALLMFVLSLIVRLVYGFYCKAKFDEAKNIKFTFDKPLFKEMFGFAGWNFIGSSSALLRDQGGNVLLNLFYGPAVNAANAVATQVKHAIVQFSSNFMVALNPQITKSYASGDRDYMMKLLFQGSRISFYMLLLLSLPVLLNTEYILSLWLKTVPNHTVLFVQLALVFGMMESISSPLITAMLATGKIRNYQIVVGGFQMLNLPISYILLRIGMLPEIVLIVAIFISVCCLLSRLYMLRGLIGLSATLFLKKVVFNVVVVSVLTVIIPFFIAKNVHSTFLWFVIISLISFICTLVVIYFIGCNKEERGFVNQKILKILKRNTI